MGIREKRDCLKGGVRINFPNHKMVCSLPPHPTLNTKRAGHAADTPGFWGRGRIALKVFPSNGANFQPSGVRTPRVGTGTISTPSLSWPLRVPSPKAPSPPLPPEVQPLTQSVLLLSKAPHPIDTINSCKVHTKYLEKSVPVLLLQNSQ